MQSSWYNENWQGNSVYLKKMCPSAILSTLNHVFGPGIKSRSLQWETSNLLIYGMAWNDVCVCVCVYVYVEHTYCDMYATNKTGSSSDDWIY
jgi:hypothetical protein